MKYREPTKKPIRIMSIDTSKISIKRGMKRLRPLRSETVEMLMQSISRVGLITPIVVRPRPRSGYWLVAGWHRLEAVRALGRETIAASVFEMNDLEAELAEIDENLLVAPLSSLERCSLARRAPAR
jgi:ParB family transcriptional regulator, chromosome partitioning protein